MTRIKLAYVHRFRKGGRLYHYFRRDGRKVRLPGLPGSAEFMGAYQAALEAKPPPIGAHLNPPGSMGALAADWYESQRFKAMSPASRSRYRSILEAYLQVPRPSGALTVALPVAGLEPRHILRRLDAMQKTPAQANAWLNVMRQLMDFAFTRGWRKDNPTRDVKRLRYERKPFPTWQEDHIALFEARWPTGSRARLALCLMLYTGQRRSDVIRMGPQHIRGGAIAVRQQKTGAELSIPVHHALRTELDAAPSGHLAFLVTAEGRPFKSGTAFYNWFQECAAAAGVPPGYSPHGLRKATTRRLIEAGCTPHEAMAITGHKSLAELQRYAAEANQPRLAAAAVVRMGRSPKNEA